MSTTLNSEPLAPAPKISLSHRRPSAAPATKGNPAVDVRQFSF
jgi:hypothetical protein